MVYKNQQDLIDQTLVFLAQVKWKDQNANFLDALVSYLCDTFELKIAFVDHIEHGDNPVAKTISLFSDGSLHKNIQYDLAYTPCENVYNKSYCAYETKVQELFPKDILLKDLNVDSYAAIPLYDSKGYPIGLIGVMDSKAFENAEDIRVVLQMSALRSAHELEQIIKNSEIQKRKENLELVVSLQKDLLAIKSISELFEKVLEHLITITGNYSLSITCTHVINNHFHICTDKIITNGNDNISAFEKHKKFIESSILEKTKVVIDDFVILIPYIDYSFNQSVLVVTSLEKIEENEAVETYLASCLLAIRSLVEKRRKVKEQTKLFQSVAELIEEKDKLLHNHINRVSKASKLFSEAMGLDSNQVSNIQIASSIHDIGKIYVADEILQRKGSLSNEEYEEIKKHATDKLLGINENEQSLLSVVGKVVRYHHENYDGTGYPEQLKGHEIPLEARIVSIVDVFEALTTERTYKEPWSYFDAIQYLQDNKGKKFDPELVEVFLTISKEVYELFKKHQ